MHNETTDESRVSNPESPYVSGSSSFSTSSDMLDFDFTFIYNNVKNNIHGINTPKLEIHSRSKISRKKHKISIKDFEKLGFLGKGPYSKVYLANKINTNKKVALKVINKVFIENVKFFIHV